jgi:hypothetical protein
LSTSLLSTAQRWHFCSWHTWIVLLSFIWVHHIGGERSKECNPTL